MATTPITTPRMVRNERILFPAMDFHAIFQDCIPMVLLLSDDPSVLNFHLPMGTRRHIGVVGYEHDGVARLMDLFKEGENLPAGAAVQIARGLIRQDQRRFGGKRPGDSCAAAARRTARPAYGSFVRPAPLFPGPLCALFPLGGPDILRPWAVPHFPTLSAGEQVEALKDEANLPAAEPGQLRSL